MTASRGRGAGAGRGEGRGFEPLMPASFLIQDRWSATEAYLRRVPVSADDPRLGRGGAATHLYGIAHVAAAAAPRPIVTE